MPAVCFIMLIIGLSSSYRQTSSKYQGNVTFNLQTTGSRIGISEWSDVVWNQKVIAHGKNLSYLKVLDQCLQKRNFNLEKTE